MNRCEESPQNNACVSSLCFGLTSSTTTSTQRSHSAHAKSSTEQNQRSKPDSSPSFLNDSVVRYQQNHYNSQIITTSNRSSSVPSSTRKCRNENLPPNILQLLRTSGDDPFASTEDE